MSTKRCVRVALFLATSGLGLAADADLPKLASANNAFAFKLLKQLAAKPAAENFFVSPYSAATALQMALNGAAGQPWTEMQQVLETSGLAAERETTSSHHWRRRVP